MSMNDPLGDMLTRIRNALMRRRPKLSTPASNLRARVLDVLAEEGYIRGYARVDYNGGKSEFEIELKYFDGEPVIKEIKRVSTPGRRVKSSNWRVSTVARADDSMISSTSCSSKSSPFSRAALTSSAFPPMTVRRLLKSWEMPPARWPRTALTLPSWRSR